MHISFKAERYATSQTLDQEDLSLVQKRRIEHQLEYRIINQPYYHVLFVILYCV